MNIFAKAFGVALLVFVFGVAGFGATKIQGSGPIDWDKYFDQNPDSDNDDQSSTVPPKIDGPFNIRPYIFSEKGGKIAVAWSYKDKSTITDKIELKLAKGNIVQKIVPEIDQDLFIAELPIPVCDFGVEISYDVTGMTQSQTINNIPCAGHANKTTKFVFLADTQEGTDYAHEFAHLIAKFNGSAVLLGGDFVQVGTEFKEWLAFFNAMDPALRQQVLIPAIGNHEYKHDKNVPFWKYFFRTPASEAYFAIDIGDAHVISLNSCFEDDPSQKIKQLAWLDSELAKPARWRVVFFHHPPYAKGITNADHYPKKEHVVLQQDYVPLFEKYGVDLVLNGHTHIFEHSIKDGIQYITSGPAGGRMGLYGAKNPYSLKADRIRTMVQLEVSNQALRAVTTTLKGRTIDEVLLKK